jgi:hypothetical protein
MQLQQKKLLSLKFLGASEDNATHYLKNLTHCSRCNVANMAKVSARVICYSNLEYIFVKSSFIVDWAQWLWSIDVSQTPVLLVLESRHSKWPQYYIDDSCGLFDK